MTRRRSAARTSTSWGSWVFVLFLLSAPMAGCLGTGDDEQAAPAGLDDEKRRPVGVTGPFAVLAFADNGINPYHADFRDDAPRAFQHPSTYLPDYPEEAETLNLTFDHRSLEAAVQTDCESWERVEPGTLYWVPGTRIVGLTALDLEHVDAVAGENFSCGESGDGWPLFIEGGEHGSYVASRGAGNAYGACKECLISAVDWVANPPSGAVWAAEQPWIDIQSNSWSWRDTASVTEQLEEAAQQQPTFVSSGNTGLADTATDHYARTPSMIRVGGHDSGRVIVWPGPSPHVVADACGAWIADHYGMEEVRPSGKGTSFSVPFAAGIAGQILLQARAMLGNDGTGVRDGVLATGSNESIDSGPVADGNLTIDEIEQVLLSTAEPRPAEREEDGEVCDDGSNVSPEYWSTPFEWRQVPEGPAGIPLIGYGAVTSDTVKHAFEVLRGEAPMPERADEDVYFDIDDARRQAVHDAWTGSLGAGGAPALDEGPDAV